MSEELNTLYDFLISVLRKEIEVYRKVRDCLLMERVILTGTSVDELYESNTKKETYILKAKMLEEARTKLVGKMIHKLDLDERNVKLSTLLSYGNDRQETELNECQSTLRPLLMDVNELNEKNRVLLNSSILYVQKSIDFLDHLLSPGAIYLNTGRLRASGMHGKFVSREG